MIKCAYCGKDVEQDSNHRVVSIDGDFACNAKCEQDYRAAMKREMDLLADPNYDLADYLDR